MFELSVHLDVIVLLTFTGIKTVFRVFGVFFWRFQLRIQNTLMTKTSCIPEGQKPVKAKAREGVDEFQKGIGCRVYALQSFSIINSANNIRSCSVVVQQLLVSLLMVSLLVSAAHEQQKAQGSAGRKTPQTQIYPPQ